jgi:hypothetical protein
VVRLRMTDDAGIDIDIDFGPVPSGFSLREPEF